MSKAVQRVLQGGGRWLLGGPRRRRVHGLLNSIRQRALGSRILIGPAAGLRVAGGDTLLGYSLGYSEPEVQRALVRFLTPGSVFFDIGANVGFFSILGCRLVGPSGQVHCFEPIAENVAQLRRNVEANGFTNVGIHRLALSDGDGTASMTLTHRRSEARLSDCGELTVMRAQLDSLDLPSPTVVKIDVEGAEIEVLRGMRMTLLRGKPILIVEIHGEREKRVRALLRNAGYASIKSLQDGMSHLLAIPDTETRDRALK